MGEESANNAQNFVLDLSDALENIYYDMLTGGSTYTPDASLTPASASDPTDRPGEIKVNNPAWGVGFGDSGYEAESGMIAWVNAITVPKGYEQFLQGMEETLVPALKSVNLYKPM